MKAFILCGGMGTRLDYESYNMPKAMVKIGKNPILFHLIHCLLKYQITEFVLCLGYKKKFIIDYIMKKFKNIISIKKSKKNLIVKVNYKKKILIFFLVDTGLTSGTGGRIKIANRHINNSDPFLMTYCDGLSNINLLNLISLHKKKGKMVTVTAVNPVHRYGILKVKKKIVVSFNNNNPKQDIFINGGFFIINPEALKLIKSNNIFWEQEPITTLIKKKELSCYKHHGFWASLDTQKDKKNLNTLWKSNKAPWL